MLLPAYAVYLAAVAYLVLSPKAEAASAGVTNVLAVLRAAGFVSVTASHLEVALNVVLFVPFGLLGLLLLPRIPWWAWGPLGLAASGLLEASQWAFLPDRSPTVSDLVANTAGSLIGALSATLVRREVFETTSGRTARPPLVSLPALAGLALVALVVMLLVVFSPSSDVQGSVVASVKRLSLRAGLPGLFSTFGLWERVLNVLLFVPLGVLCALTRPGWSVLRWAVVGMVLSLGIEVVQGLLLPGRDASVSDVVMNTVGMVLGVALVRLLPPARIA